MADSSRAGLCFLTVHSCAAELAAVRAATLYSSQHAWAGDKLVPAEAKSALRSASEAASEAQELADTGPVPVPVSTSNGGDSDRELQEVSNCAVRTPCTACHFGASSSIV